MSSREARDWAKRDYVNFFLGLMAPIILYYFIVVAPAIVFDVYFSDDCDCEEATGENTWIENVFPGELFIFAGLFTYPAIMVLYFLFRGTIGRQAKGVSEVFEETEEDLRSALVEFTKDMSDQTAAIQERLEALEKNSERE